MIDSFPGGVSSIPPEHFAHFDQDFGARLLPVAARLRQFLDDLRVFGDQRSASESLTRTVNSEPSGAIEYRRYARPFAKAYLETNFWKAAAIMTAIGAHDAADVVDLGAGTGAFALGALAIFNLAHSGLPRREIHVTLVDRSSTQLELASAAIAYAKPALDNLTVRVSTKLADVIGQEYDQPRADLVLLAHVATENPDRVLPLVSSAFGFVRPGGELVVVERADDPVWSDVLDASISAYSSMSAGQVSVSIGDTVDRDGRDVVARWLSMLMPTHPDLPRMVELYFSAWRHQDPELLPQVFDANASYQEKPFDDPIVGIEAIRRYWREHVVPQQDLAIEVVAISYGPSSAFVEWISRFRIGACSTRVRGAMILEVDLSVGRVTQLREYFRTAREVVGPE